LQWINQHCPSLLSDQKHQELIDTLSSDWFGPSCIWRRAVTLQRYLTLKSVLLSSRKTNNALERFHRTVDESIFFGMVGTSVEQEVRKLDTRLLIDPVRVRGQFSTKELGSTNLHRTTIAAAAMLVDSVVETTDPEWFIVCAQAAPTAGEPIERPDDSRSVYQEANDALAAAVGNVTLPDDSEHVQLEPLYVGLYAEVVSALKCCAGALHACVEKNVAAVDMAVSETSASYERARGLVPDASDPEDVCARVVPFVDLCHSLTLCARAVLSAMLAGVSWSAEHALSSSALSAWRLRGDCVLRAARNLSGAFKPLVDCCGSEFGISFAAEARSKLNDAEAAAKEAIELTDNLVVDDDEVAMAGGDTSLHVDVAEEYTFERAEAMYLRPALCVLSEVRDGVPADAAARQMMSRLRAGALSLAHCGLKPLPGVARTVKGHRVMYSSSFCSCAAHTVSGMRSFHFYCFCMFSSFCEMFIF